MIYRKNHAFAKPDNVKGPSKGTFMARTLGFLSVAPARLSHVRELCKRLTAWSVSGLLVSLAVVVATTASGMRLEVPSA
jgi:hypothetical protein